MLRGCEKRVWVEMQMTKENIQESDLAEAIAEHERELPKIAELAIQNI